MKRIFTTRSFSSSPPFFQLPGHTLYKSIDWARVHSGQWAVVDPNDPHSILYLEDVDYITLTRVMITSRKKLLVLATPDDNPISPSPSDDSFKNSPPVLPGESKVHPIKWNAPLTSDVVGWLQNPFRHIKRVKVNPISGQEERGTLALISEGNLWGLVGLWALSLHTRLMGLKSPKFTRLGAYNYSKYLRKILITQGVNRVILLLKIHLFVVNSFLSGNRLTSTYDLGFKIKLSHGLPKALPLTVRKAIRSRRWDHIRLWVSIFYIYKGLFGVHKPPAFSNIAAPPLNTNCDSVKKHLNGFREYVDFVFKPEMTSFYSVEDSPDLTIKEPFLSNRAGPNFSHSFLGIFLDTLAYSLSNVSSSKYLENYLKAVGDKRLFSLFQAAETWARRVFDEIIDAKYSSSDILANVNNVVGVLFNFKSLLMFAQKVRLGKPSDHPGKSYFDLLDREVHLSYLNIVQQLSSFFSDGLNLVKLVGGLSTLINKVIKYHKNGEYNKLRTGKLSLVLEAAGKVRIIAIVDWWTQTALQPLHNWLFKTLRCFGETDATFDQEGSVEAFSNLGFKELYSFDLKAATDLIPLDLYRIVLGAFLGKEIAKAWGELLTLREYYLPTWTRKLSSGKIVAQQLKHAGSSSIRYTRGQPMGALSSWGALALVHHALVRYSACLAGKMRFTSYMVLGDDVVIAGQDVALKYQEVCQSLGITLSLSKSLISHEGLFNFASQTVLDDINLSPFSFKGELQASTGFDRMTVVLKSATRNLITLSDNSWYQRLARFVLPRGVYTSLESSRKRGHSSPISQVVSVLLTGTLLSSLKSKLSIVLGESGIISVIRSLVRPDLTVFSQSLDQLKLGVEKSKDLSSSVHDLLDALHAYAGKAFVKSRELAVSRLVSLFCIVPELLYGEDSNESPIDENGLALPEARVNLRGLVDLILKYTNLDLSPKLSESPPEEEVKTREVYSIYLLMLSLPFISAWEDFFLSKLRDRLEKAHIPFVSKEEDLPFEEVDDLEAYPGEFDHMDMDDDDLFEGALPYKGLQIKDDQHRDMGTEAYYKSVESWISMRFGQHVGILPPPVDKRPSIPDRLAQINNLYDMEAKLELTPKLTFKTDTEVPLLSQEGIFDLLQIASSSREVSLIPGSAPNEYYLEDDSMLESRNFFRSTKKNQGRL
jgi:hypothetical protein